MLTHPTSQKQTYDDIVGNLEKESKDSPVNANTGNLFLAYGYEMVSRRKADLDIALCTNHLFGTIYVL